jgi:hypothetical protein
MSATTPTIAASRVISRISKFRMCDISWATTAWSSSRSSVVSNPSVTAMCAWKGSRPVANALGSGSGMIQILGLGRPAAMAISSTTLSSRLSSGVAGSISSCAPVAASTRPAPWRQATQAIRPEMAQATSPMNGITW